MAFELQVAEAADGPRIADVFFAAFADEFDRKMLPPDQPDVRSWMEKMILGEGPDTGKEILLKVVDPSNPEVIAGFARWVFPVREPHADDEKQDQNWSGWPEGADPELCDTFFSTMEKHHKEVMGDRPHYCTYLALLMSCRCKVQSAFPRPSRFLLGKGPLFKRFCYILEEGETIAG